MVQAVYKSKFVTGTYRKILKRLKRLNTIPRLVSAFNVVPFSVKSGNKKGRYF